MPFLPDPRTLSAWALAAPAVLLVAEALRLLTPWSWHAAPGGLAVVWSAAVASLAACALLLLRSHPDEASSRLDEARALHAEAVDALTRAMRLVEEADAASPPAPAPSRSSRRGALVGAALAVLLAASAAGLWSLAVPEGAAQPVLHEHARFAVVADGRLLDYGHPAFDVAARGDLRGHLHAPDGETLHIEGPPGLTFATFFERTLLGRMGPDGVALDEAIHGGRVFPAEDVRLLVSTGAGGAWGVVADPLAFEPREGDRILLILGAPPEAPPAWAADAPLG